MCIVTELFGIVNGFYGTTVRDSLGVTKGE